MEEDGDVTFEVSASPEDDLDAGVTGQDEERGAADRRPDEQEEQEQEEEDEAEEDEEDDVPLFANRENRLLRKQLLAVDRKTEELSEAVIEETERRKAIEDHIRSVQQEHRHAEQLAEAKRKELESEEHMRRLAERDAGRIRTDISNLKGKKDDILSQLTNVQNEIFKANEIMDKYKLTMNFNQEELEQWTLAMNQNQDDKDAFEKYMKADSAKVKELNYTIEKLTMQLQEARKQLGEEVTETQAKQIELDKTAEEFRARHRERQDVLRQWQDAIAAVKARDEEIQRAGQIYAACKEDYKVARKELDAGKARLENLEQDCADMDSNSKLLDAMLQKKRGEETEAKARTDNFQAEVELVKTEVSKASKEVQQHRSQLVNSKVAVEEANVKLEGARERYQHAKVALEEAKSKNLDAEQSALAAEEAVKRRGIEIKQVEQRLAALKDAMFRESEQLHALRQNEANLLAEIAGAQATGKNLTAEIQKLDDESLRQKELVYAAEFQIQQLERKVARANGVRSDEEKKVLTKKIAAAQSELDAAQQQHTMLLTQTKNLEEELRASKRQAETTTVRRQELAARIAELKLENSSAESTLSSIMKQKEELMVSNDLMKLQVKSLRDQLTERADKVFGLENRKFQLEMSMQERKKEIQVHSDMQRARAKIAEEERHKLAIEAKERKLAVSKLEKRFATICSSSQTEDGKERSQAYFVIAAAQRREELQREGDELDSKIRKASREIRALEETLNNINSLNSQVRVSSHRADPKSKEAQEFKRLVNEAKSTKETAFTKKKELERLSSDIEEDKRRIRQLQEQAALAYENKIHLERTRKQIEQELSQQSAQLSRAEKRVREHSQHHRISLGLPADRETIFETLFRIEMNNQVRDSVLFTLGQLSKEFPEIESEIQSQLSRFGLNIPSAPPRPATSIADPTVSSSSNQFEPML